MVKAMLELKPCPFCGGEAEFNLFCGYVCITCTECMGGVLPARGNTKEQAAKDWNRRIKEAPSLKPLTLEDLQRISEINADHVWPYNTPPYFWLEQNKNNVSPCWACWRDVHDALTRGLHGCHPEYYGKTWRCWEHEPTDEEREAAPWEE